MIRPRELPKLRRQLAAQLGDPTASVRAHTGEAMQPALDRLANAVRAAELYWVAPDMAALAVQAGSQLAAARWTVADRPAACGLLWWGDGVHQIRFGADVYEPIDAVSWGPDPEGTVLWTYIHRDRVRDAVRVTGGELVTDDVPPLVPMQGVVLPLSDEPISVARISESMGGQTPTALAMTLAAAWLLMGQPTLVERTRESAGRAEGRSAARAGLPLPDVTRVDLRRQYTPQDRDPDAGGDGRRYRHRWIVSGHWRNQAHGPDRSLRRQTWVPSYVKGPDGAPLLSTEKVNVWRR